MTRSHSANYLRAHSRTGFLPQSARPASVEPPDEKLTVPKANTARDVSLSSFLACSFVKLQLDWTVGSCGYLFLWLDYVVAMAVIKLLVHTVQISYDKSNIILLSHCWPYVLTLLWTTAI